MLIISTLPRRQVLYDCLDKATSILTEEAVEMGRRCVEKQVFVYWVWVC